jgi:DNA-3-methyladenine glycosylase II
VVEFSLSLPLDYRFSEVAAFHARDPLALAEKLSGGEGRDWSLVKGLVLDGRPVVLSINIPGRASRAADQPAPASQGVETRHHPAEGAVAQVLVSVIGEADPKSARSAALKMLGLATDPTSFENSFAKDEVLGPLLARRQGLRIPQTPTAFEALTWAIIGQQINLAFAIQLRRSLIQACGQRVGGLACYPGPAEVANLDPQALGALKFSRAKAEALVGLAQSVASGSFPLEALRGRPPEEIAERLQTFKGVGPWTAQYTLLRGYNCEDCSLHGDAAIRNALQRLLGRAQKIESAEAETWLEGYRPHRSLVAAHLWASLAPT